MLTKEHTRMMGWVFVLWLCLPACTARNAACDWVSEALRGVAMECSGATVTGLPWTLRASLELLRLRGTAIASLDSTTFQDRDLAALTVLYVTDGILQSVGPDTFCSLSALTKLDLSHNQLHLLDDSSFSCNKDLRSVSLANNTRLRQVPRLVSSSVQTMYLDYCGLTTVDVDDVAGMTALDTLSLIGNPDLDCSSVRTRFKQARPDLLVICEDSSSDLPSPLDPVDPVSSTQNTPNLSDSGVSNTENGASGISKIVPTIALVLLSSVIVMFCR